jgi:hypothetical protein
VKSAPRGSALIVECFCAKGNKGKYGPWEKHDCGPNALLIAARNEWGVSRMKAAERLKVTPQELGLGSVGSICRHAKCSLDSSEAMASQRQNWVIANWSSFTWTNIRQRRNTTSRLQRSAAAMMVVPKAVGGVMARLWNTPSSDLRTS